MRGLLKRIVLQVSLIGVGFILALAIQAAAFTEPTSNPPAGNVYAPINTGPISQDKSDPTNDSAWITADGLGSRYGALFATVSGNVGIGTTSPQYPLDIQMNGAIPVVALRANNNADLQWYRNGVGGYMWDLSSRGTNTSPSDSLQLYATSSRPIMTWQQNGNVGVGITNPNASVEIVNTNPNQWALYAVDNSGYYTGLDAGGWSVYGNGSGYLGGNLQVAGTISAGGPVVYVCPYAYNTSCQSQLQLASSCVNYVNGSWTSCTPVGHLVY